MDFILSSLLKGLSHFSDLLTDRGVINCEYLSVNADK